MFWVTWSYRVGQGPWSEVSARGVLGRRGAGWPAAAPAVAAWPRSTDGAVSKSTWTVPRELLVDLEVLALA